MDAPTSPSARLTLLVLVVVAGALTAGAILQRDRALEQAYEDAQARAELYSATVLRSALAADDLTGPLSDARRSAMLEEIEPLILSDPAVARVRLWSPSGTLLFSSDAGDTGVTSEDPIIASAATGLPQSRLGVESVSRSGDATPTPLFQSFVPLRLRGATEVGAVAEVEQFVATLESTADDPWWIVQVAASAATVLLALLAFVSVARGAKRGLAEASSRRRERRAGSGADTADLRSRLEAATMRAEEAERSADAYAAQLQQATARLEELERRTPDERVAELREALRTSEAERALLRAGRPETTVEVELRQLRAAVQEARSRAKAAEALAAGKGDLSAVQEEIAAAERETAEAIERARLAEARADVAEEQARATAELAVTAEQRIDQLEIKLQEVASTAVSIAEPVELEALRQELTAATTRAEELERRLADADTSSPERAVSDETLGALEERIAAAERRATEAEERLRVFEAGSAEEGSRFRHTLGVRAAGRKLAAPPPSEREVLPDEPEVAIRKAISRGLRGPLTRAAGLTLSLQGAVDSTEGKSVVRQLSSSLRRLDQLTADLHDVHRIADGTLQLNRRRTDLSGLLTTTLEEADLLHEDRLVRLDAERVHADVDPVRMRQIVEGMLEAAKERTRAGAAIVVRARTTDRGVMVSVEDDNKIPTEVGPELSLAARLAELHGTQLVAEASSFRVFLPPAEG